MKLQAQSVWVEVGIWIELTMNANFCRLCSFLFFLLHSPRIEPYLCLLLMKETRLETDQSIYRWRYKPRPNWHRCCRAARW